MNDPETECIVMIGEIGGQLMLPSLIKADGNRKPVGFIAELLSPGRTMGHAGNRWWI
jgi:succinyl-CoA synthetase alpha subunit